MRVGSLRTWALRLDPDHPERMRRWLGEAVREGAIPAVRRGRGYYVAEADLAQWWRSIAAPIPSDARAWARARAAREVSS